MRSHYIKKVGILHRNDVVKTWKKQKQFVFFLFVLVLFVFSTIYDSPKDLDRYENYTIGSYIANMSYEDIYSYYSSNGYDFIFYLGLGFFAKHQLMPLFMGLITALYYIAVFKGFNNISGRLTLNSGLMLAGLLCFPSILYVVNISRTIFSLFFFAVGVNQWLVKKYKYHLLFFTLSLFTHVGTAIFIGLFYAGVVAFMFLKNKPSFTGLLELLLPPFFFVLFRYIFLSVLHNEFMMDLFFDTKYMQYYDATGTATLKVSIGAILSIYGEILLSYVLINLDKKVTFNKVMLLVFTTMAASTLSVNQNLLNRFILVLPIFYSLYFLELFGKFKLCEKTNVSRLNWLTISSCFSVLFFLLILYQERKSFLPFLFG